MKNRLTKFCLSDDSFRNCLNKIPENLLVFIINVTLKVNQPEDISTVREHLRKAAALSRLEPGCLQFEAMQDQDDPSCLLLFERWASKQDWEIHKQAEAFQTIYLPLVLPKVSRTPHFCDPLE